MNTEEITPGKVTRWWRSASPSDRRMMMSVLLALAVLYPIQRLGDSLAVLWTRAFDEMIRAAETDAGPIDVMEDVEDLGNV